jgi:dynein light intermediate chain, axonemal
LDCPERGLMLLRVRDERKMTINVHQTVYEEGVSYGQAKQSESEIGILELEGQIQAL